MPGSWVVLLGLRRAHQEVVPRREVDKDTGCLTAAAAAVLGSRSNCWPSCSIGVSTSFFRATS